MQGDIAAMDCIHHEPAAQLAEGFRRKAANRGPHDPCARKCVAGLKHEACHDAGTETRWTHAVPRKAAAKDDVAVAAEMTEHRQAIARTIDRADPAGLGGEALEVPGVAVEFAGHQIEPRRRPFEPISHMPGKADLAAPLAVHHPAIRKSAECSHHETRVVDIRPAAPPHSGDLFRYGPRHCEFGGRNQDGGAKLGHPAEPGVDRQDQPFGANATARCLDLDRPPACKPCHRGAFENSHALLECNTPQGEGELRRIDGGAAPVDDAGVEAVETPVAFDLTPGKLFEGVEVAAREGRGCGRPCPHMRLAGCGPEPAVATEAGDTVVAAEALNLVNRAHSLPAKGHGFIGATNGLECGKARPPVQDIAGIAPAGATTAEIALQYDDVETGLFLLQDEGCPEPGEATADDDNVGAGLARERRAGPEA